MNQGNSDYLKRVSDNTNGRFPSSTTGTSRSGTSASDFQSPGWHYPTKFATSNTLNACVVDDKDQARSVDDAFSCDKLVAACCSSRLVGIRSAPFQNMPIVTAVPMTYARAA